MAMWPLFVIVLALTGAYLVLHGWFPRHRP